jgi:hypothetical protein
MNELETLLPPRGAFRPTTRPAGVSPPAALTGPVVDRVGGGQPPAEVIRRKKGKGHAVGPLTIGSRS